MTCPTTTRIIHLSDLHLTSADTDSRSEPKLFGNLTGMNAAFRKILFSKPLQEADRILITGDITDSGHPDQWAIFWHAVQAARLQDRLILIPGNHDVCCLGLRRPWSTPDAPRRDLDRFLAGLRIGGLEPSDGKYPAAIPVNDSVVIFILNSNNLGNFSAISNAMGEFSYFDLERFARLLYSYRQFPVKIVALHHSPNIPQPETAGRRGNVPMSKYQRLTHQIPKDQRRIMRLLCLSHRVRLIIHGHLHLNEDRSVNSIRIIGAPASTEPATLNGRSCYRFWRYDIDSSAPFRIRHHLISL